MSLPCLYNCNGMFSCSLPRTNSFKLLRVYFTVRTIFSGKIDDWFHRDCIQTLYLPGLLQQHCGPGGFAEYDTWRYFSNFIVFFYTFLRNVWHLNHHRFGSCCVCEFIWCITMRMIVPPKISIDHSEFRSCTFFDFFCDGVLHIIRLYWSWVLKFWIKLWYVSTVVQHNYSIRVWSCLLISFDSTTRISFEDAA